jgi:hypothetical protein
VERLLERGAYPAAYEEAAALLGRAPHDARAQELFVRAASLALRLDAAERQLETALAEHPDDLGLQAAQAEWLFGKGDEIAARAAVERVLRADATHPVATEIARALDLADRARARVDQQGTRFEPGSPQAFVDAFLESGVRGKDATALAADVDLDLLRNADQRSPLVIANFIGRFIDDARAAAARGDQRFFGWLVAPTVTPDGDRVRVHVDVPGEAVFTEARRRFIERALADPSLRGVAERDAIERLLAIPEAERPPSWIGSSERGCARRVQWSSSSCGPPTAGGSRTLSSAGRAYAKRTRGWVRSDGR